MLSYYNPVKIIKTKDWNFELNRNIKNLNITSPFIISSFGNRKRLELDSKFNGKKIFSDIVSNPNFDDCTKVIEFCNNNSFDGVIAIGGGSVMDLAKIVVAKLSLNKSDISELISFKDKYPNNTPSIFIPTTHGTASEVTMWGTIWNTKKKKKYSISHPDLYPTIAILDGSLTLSLPMKNSIITVMDALSHSFEAIWNKNSNIKSTEYAIEAITIILNNAQFLKEKPSDQNIRNKLLWASTLAGLAFSNTKTAAAHSMSYPLTIHYGIPHGIASSISLIPLLEINGNSIESELNIICNLLNVSLDELINKINQIPEGVLSYKLSDWGLKREDLEFLSNESFTKGRMDNNIVDLSSKDVLQIFEQLYN